MKILYFQYNFNGNIHKLDKFNEISNFWLVLHKAFILILWQKNVLSLELKNRRFPKN